MDIKEYWGKLIAAGLDTNSTNVYVCDKHGDGIWFIDNCKEFKTLIPFMQVLMIGKAGEIIQLRKDGKDLYELEWKKPEQGDIGKMCWFMSSENNSIIQSGLFTIEIMCELICGYVAELDFDDAIFDYCLLADHGQIAPTPENFKKVYGV